MKQRGAKILRQLDDWAADPRPPWQRVSVSMARKIALALLILTIGFANFRSIHPPKAIKLTLPAERIKVANITLRVSPDRNLQLTDNRTFLIDGKVARHEYSIVLPRYPFDPSSGKMLSQDMIPIEYSVQSSAISIPTSPLASRTLEIESAVEEDSKGELSLPVRLPEGESLPPGENRATTQYTAIGALQFNSTERINSITWPVLLPSNVAIEQLVTNFELPASTVLDSVQIRLRTKVSEWRETRFAPDGSPYTTKFIRSSFHPLIDGKKEMGTVPSVPI